jgi:hypothetical protein
MAVLGSAALLTAEVNAGIEVFNLLEPEIQRGFIGLFRLFHHKQTQLAAAQNGAPTVDGKSSLGDQVPQPAPVAEKDLSSTSLDPEMPSPS